MVWENYSLDSQSILISLAKLNISIGRSKRYLLRVNIFVMMIKSIMHWKSNISLHGLQNASILAYSHTFFRCLGISPGNETFCKNFSLLFCERRAWCGYCPCRRLAVRKIIWTIYPILLWLAGGACPDRSL